MIFPKADFHMVRSSMVGQKANGICQHKTHCRFMAKGHVLAAAARHTAHRDNLLRFSISVTENKALFTPFLQSASLPAGKPLPIQDAHFSLFHPKIDYLNMLSLFSFCFLFLLPNLINTMKLCQPNSSNIWATVLPSSGWR